LDDAIDYGNSDLGARYRTGFSNPLLRNNILCNNRANFYTLTDNSLNDAGVIDLGVAGNPGLLFTTPQHNIMTSIVGYDQLWRDNVQAPAGTMFVNEYENGSPFASSAPQEFKTVQVAPALDEGGNWIEVRYAPLSINDIDADSTNADVPSDYHLNTADGAIPVNAGTGNRGGAPNLDIDGEPRVGTVDIGSDEVQ
jgi:hypothetical protein